MEATNEPPAALTAPKAPARLWAAVRASDIARAVLLVAGLRLALGATAVVALQVSPAPAVLGDEWSSLRTTSPSWYAPLVAPWQHWDALWYQRLALQGYQPRSDDAAFLPLYPGAMRVLGAAFGGNLVLAGLLISTVALVVALVVVERLVRMDLDAAAARRTTLYIALCPLAFFFLMPYTESLFLALSAGALLAARRRSWWMAGICAALATLDRSTGVLLMVPLAVMAWGEVQERRALGERGVAAGMVTITVPVLALGGWMLWTKAALGVLGGPPAAQGRWGQHAVPPWTAIHESIQTIAAGTHPEEILNLAAVVLLAGAIPFMWRRLPAPMTAYALVSIPVLCFRTAAYSPLMSAGRYLIVVFPVFVLLASMTRRWWVHGLLLAPSALLMAWLFVDMVVNDAFIG
jgi:hypothetical protein